MGTSVGYMNPNPAITYCPTYEEICEATTGFVEVAHILFDNSKASFEQVTKHFFTFHDPTTHERQGNDAGSQYTSVIFYHSPEQKAISEKVIEAVNDLIANRPSVKVNLEKDKVATQVKPATKYFEAEDYHQRYLESQPWGYCNHGIKFAWDDET